MKVFVRIATSRSFHYKKTEIIKVKMIMKLSKYSDSSAISTESNVSSAVASQSDTDDADGASISASAHAEEVPQEILSLSFDMDEIKEPIAIGNPLKSSPDFPPLSTVHESFPSHGAPSPSTLLFHTHDLERLDTHQSGFFTVVVQFGFLLRG